MINDFYNLININEYEVLRYLEYKGQDIDDNLKKVIQECIQITKSKINPRYILRVYPILRINNEIKLKDTNIKFVSEDLYNLLGQSNECIILSANLGMDIEREIKKYSYTELTKSIIIDACATTAIEEYCDLIEKHIADNIIEKGKYITYRYSPGYGDLSINYNKDIIELLNSTKEIGLTITENKIMIPRKSVLAVIGISNIDKSAKKSCMTCNNYNNCKYKKGDESCGYKRLHTK